MAAATTPLRYVVTERRVETADTASLTLGPLDTKVARPRAGQFMMLTAFGVGEVPISVSRIGTDGSLVHTIRAVDPVSRALYLAEPETVIGLRGPFGTDWNVGNTGGHDLVFVAGGIGLASLRPAIDAVINRTWRVGRIVVLVGARTPDDLLFRSDLAAWERRSDIALAVTVDQAHQGWRGNVGLVATLLRRANFTARRTTAFVCGPEIMMRVVATQLLECGVPPADIRVSLERNMHCGNGLCGHCQLGSVLLCRDGPVISYDRVTPLLAAKEL